MGYESFGQEQPGELIGRISLAVRPGNLVSRIAAGERRLTTSEQLLHLGWVQPAATHLQLNVTKAVVPLVHRPLRPSRRRIGAILLRSRSRLIPLLLRLRPPPRPHPAATHPRPV